MLISLTSTHCVTTRYKAKETLDVFYQETKYVMLLIFISPYSVAFGVILSLLFLFFCTVEDISTQDGAIGVKF